jgi:hypothetical protein
MPEPNGQGDPPADNPPPENPPALSSFIAEDGTLKEGWLEALVPEDFRALGVYKTITDLPTAFKQLGNLEKLKGKQGKGLIPPSDDATPTERELFYNALGRPPKPEDYKIEIPKELAEFYDDGVIKETREALHAAGLTQKQVDAVMALDAKRLVAGAKQVQEEALAEKADAETALKAKWGAAYPERLHIANRMISENVADESEKERLLAVIGNDPYVADFLANIGKKFMEGTVIATEETGAGQMTPAEAKLKMQELIAERAADREMRMNNPAKYARLNREIERLARLSLAGQGET